MRILLTGGGTLGSVTPLVAIAEELRSRMKHDGVSAPEILWVGTRKGIERKFLLPYAIPFTPIFSGKLRTYFDIRNFIDPFLLCIGIFQSIGIIMRFRPDIIIGAGGYVSVPVLYAGWLLRKKSVLLQLDLLPSLSNLMTAFTASSILVAFEEEKKYFPSDKTHVVGIPLRKSLAECAERLKVENGKRKAREHFGVHDDLPILLVVGGGTGALALNVLIEKSIGELTEFCHVVHITGKGKGGSGEVSSSHYHRYEFLDADLPQALVVADAVVTRAGMGFLAELAFLEKPCVIIPIPDSQQERNALFIEKRHAGVYCSQDTITSTQLVSKIRKLFGDKKLRDEYGAVLKALFPQDAARKAVDHILEL